MPESDQVQSDNPGLSANSADNNLETALEDDQEIRESADSIDHVPDDQERLDRILKIRMPVIVRIAERRMTIENILKLSIGSIIQFDKDAYQMIDLMINNSVIGLGQPVKIGENFGIKIIQIGDITNTIKSLGK